MASVSFIAGVEVGGAIPQFFRHLELVNDRIGHESLQFLVALLVLVDALGVFHEVTFDKMLAAILLLTDAALDVELLSQLHNHSCHLQKVIEDEQIVVFADLGNKLDQVGALLNVCMKHLRQRLVSLSLASVAFNPEFSQKSLLEASQSLDRWVFCLQVVLLDGLFELDKFNIVVFLGGIIDHIVIIEVDADAWLQLRWH